MAIAAAQKVAAVATAALNLVMSLNPVMILVVALVALAGALVAAYFRFEEVRVIVDPDSIDDTNRTYIARDIAKRVSEEMTFPGELRVTVLREMRTVEYAR